MTRSRPAAVRRTVAFLAVAVLAVACRAGGVGRVPAPGAGASPPAATAAPGGPGRCTLAPTGGLIQRTISAPGPTSPATARTYQLYVPRGVTAGSSVPLLVSLHGLGANGTIQNAVTRWSAFDDQQAAAGAPFVLALPDGLSTLWFWGLEGSYDVSFVFDVIAQVVGSGCVDRGRVYVDGWSEGAYMAQRMACDSAGPAAGAAGIALAAVHGYAGGDPAVVPQSCRPAAGAKAPAILLSQGLDDTLVQPQKMGFPAFQAWGTRYACRPPAAQYTAPQQLTGCRAGTAVDWWPIGGFGHLTWSCSSPFWHDAGIWAFLTRRSAPTSSTCP